MDTNNAMKAIMTPTIVPIPPTQVQKESLLKECGTPKVAGELLTEAKLAEDDPIAARRRDCRAICCSAHTRGKVPCQCRLRRGQGIGVCVNRRRTPDG